MKIDNHKDKVMMAVLNDLMRVKIYPKVIETKHEKTNVENSLMEERENSSYLTNNKCIVIHYIKEILEDDKDDVSFASTHSSEDARITPSNITHNRGNYFFRRRPACQQSYSH